VTLASGSSPCVTPRALPASPGTPPRGAPAPGCSPSRASPVPPCLSFPQGQSKGGPTQGGGEGRADAAAGGTGGRGWWSWGRWATRSWRAAAAAWVPTGSSTPRSWRSASLASGSAPTRRPCGMTPAGCSSPTGRCGRCRWVPPRGQHGGLPPPSLQPPPVTQPGCLSPARGYPAGRGEGAAHRTRGRAHRHHHRWRVPSSPARHRRRSLDQCPCGTPGPPPAAAGKGRRHRGVAQTRPGLTQRPQPLRIDVCYWREKEPGSPDAGRAAPCFMAVGLSRAPHGVYGLPALEYPGLVKVSSAWRWWGDPLADPPLTGCPPGVLPPRQPCGPR